MWIRSVYGGATFCSWYPITPSTSVAEGFEKYASKYRVDPQTGKNNYISVQAEDELAAVGMAIGAIGMAQEASLQQAVRHFLNE